MPRLDRLGAAAKEVVQIGADIGREFSHALLSAVVSKPESELALALERQIAACLLFRQACRRTRATGSSMLVQDTAYGTLLREPCAPVRSRSPNFDHRRRPETLRTAMATAFF
jgi:predicted ATPase